MAAEYGIKLAVQLISTHFGNLVSRVCECLLQKGTLTLAQIAKFTELSQESVRTALLVLIQHNCVQAFAQEQRGAFGEANRVSTQYMAMFGNIIHRMRFPKFLMIVSEELGKECEEVFEGLLQHGRLTVEQIIERAKPNKNEDSTFLPEAVREHFTRLVNARYVERCPVPEPFLALPADEDAPPKKRGSGSAKRSEVRESIEQRAVAAAAPMEAKRFLAVTDTVADVKRESNWDEKPSIRPGEKRKYDASEMVGEPGDSYWEKEVLWRANFEEFVSRLRDKACIANVRSWLDDGAAIVFSAMLEATRSAGDRVSLNTIYEEVIKSEVGRTMTKDHVRASLAQLKLNGVKGHPDELYTIELQNIIELAQTHEVESIVLKRYGREAYRIFRLLSKESCAYETDKISDITFVEKKDAARILYKMWKDEYLHMEKAVVTSGRQFQFLLWQVNRKILWERVLDEMYHAALNLIQRTAYEMEQESEILLLPKDRLGTLQGRYKRLVKVRKLLESSLAKLDDAIMLFHDFRY